MDYPLFVINIRCESTYSLVARLVTKYTASVSKSKLLVVKTSFAQFFEKRGDGKGEPGGLFVLFYMPVKEQPWYKSR